MFSICPHLGSGGVSWPGPDTEGTPSLDGGYPHPVLDRGVPQPGPDGGWGGYPGQVQMWGIPWTGGYPLGGGTPPGREYPLPTGGTPRYRTTDGVLDTSRSVCLLRSRRRTF